MLKIKRVRQLCLREMMYEHIILIHLILKPQVLILGMLLHHVIIKFNGNNENLSFASMLDAWIIKTYVNVSELRRQIASDIKFLICLFLQSGSVGNISVLLILINFSI